ncbi:MAG: Stp1/IreP family PP2C-type Ser/Thr phosphatase [Clostridia bacterium]|nr:Stp1/IreP family PP2C-type Ser/Thr phosphatase [Clostridia bacterium]
MEFYGMTDIGKKRAANEDMFETLNIGDNAVLLVVCDGMGGVAGGAEASKKATEVFCREVKALAEKNMRGGSFVVADPDTEIPMMLENAASSANFVVWQIGQDNKELHGLGTTIVAVFVTGKTAYIINVGDSRAYLVRETGIKQLTHDHSLVQMLLDKGEITAAEAEKHPGRNVITKAIGVSLSCESETYIEKLKAGDVLLLCSDGLYGMVSEKEISKTVSTDESLKTRVGKLIAMANDFGGEDNITAVLAEI